jgi:sugar phosphate isomerase/epimerase
MHHNLDERLGCSTITFRHLPLNEALQNIASTGLKKVDIACIPGFCPHIDPLEISEQEESAIKERLDELGMAVSTLNVSVGGLNTERKEYVYRFIEAAIDLAARLGCYAITIPSGSKVSTDKWEENTSVSAKSIQKLADRADEKGIRLTVEAPHPGTLAETRHDTRRFFTALQDPRVACTFDTSHVARGNPEPVKKFISETGTEIGHVHLRDCIGENNHLTPGKGEVDFQGVLDTLAEEGYTGDIILELEGEDSQSALEELTYAVNYIKGLES